MSEYLSVVLHAIALFGGTYLIGKGIDNMPLAIGIAMLVWYLKG